MKIILMEVYRILALLTNPAHLEYVASQIVTYVREGKVERASCLIVLLTIESQLPHHRLELSSALQLAIKEIREVWSREATVVNVHSVPSDLQVAEWHHQALKGYDQLLSDQEFDEELGRDLIPYLADSRVSNVFTMIVACRTLYALRDRIATTLYDTCVSILTPHRDDIGPTSQSHLSPEFRTFYNSLK